MLFCIIRILMERDVTPDNDGQPRFRARRGLPSGRALVGALLVTVAAMGAFSLATGAETGPSNRYLVVSRDVETGTVLGPDDVAPAPMDLSPTVAANALGSPDQIEGAVALRFLRAGELLDARSISPATTVDDTVLDDVHELTFPVRRSRAPARLRRGDRVTVLVQRDPGVVTAFEDALVLSYATEGSGVAVAQEGVLTVALDDTESVARGALLTHDDDDLTVVLTTRALTAEYPERYRLADPADSADLADTADTGSFDPEPAADNRDGTGS